MTNVFKKCLLIGINYTGTENQLEGCIHDSDNVKNYFETNKYFDDNDMIIMNDFQKEDLYPSKDNILKQFDNLVNMALQNPTCDIKYVVAYSGHGTTESDPNSLVQKKHDECLCPIDCMDNGFIADQYLKDNFVDKLPANVTLVIFVDACHSATIMDLKYCYFVDAKTKCKINAKENTTQCNVVLISGCKDGQTSCDAYLPYDPKFNVDADTDIDPDNKSKFVHEGAMTTAFLEIYHDNILPEDLIASMRSWLKKNKFSQVPQFSSGKDLDLTQPFILASFK